MPPTMMIGGGGGGGGGGGKGFPGSVGTRLPESDTSFERAMGNIGKSLSNRPEIEGRPTGYGEERRSRSPRSTAYNTRGERSEVEQLTTRVTPQVERAALTGHQLAVLKSLESRAESSGSKIERLRNSVARGEMPQAILDEVAQYEGDPEKVNLVLRELQKMKERSNPPLSEEARIRMARREREEKEAEQAKARAERQAREAAAAAAAARAAAPLMGGGGSAAPRYSINNYNPLENDRQLQKKAAANLRAIVSKYK